MSSYAKIIADVGLNVSKNHILIWARSCFVITSWNSFGLTQIKPVFTPSIMIILIILKFWKSKHDSQQHSRKIQKCLFCGKFITSRIPILFAGASFWVSLVVLRGTSINIIIINDIITVECQTNHTAASIRKSILIINTQHNLQISIRELLIKKNYRIKNTKKVLEDTSGVIEHTKLLTYIINHSRKKHRQAISILDLQNAFGEVTTAYY